MLKNFMGNYDAEIPITVKKLTVDSKKTAEIADLIIQMKKMGIDPQPYFSLAAQDIILKFGVHALEAAEITLNNCKDLNKPDLLYVWREVFLILKKDLWVINSKIN